MCIRDSIYNEQYKLVDPDYETVRPRDNADVVARLWGAVKSKTRLLDYGGGNDQFCAALRENGFAAAVTYDPMVPEYARRPEGKFDLVTSFETLEHLPDPVAGIALMIEFAADPGLIFFTTYAQPADFDRHGMNWWYLAPVSYTHLDVYKRQSSGKTHHAR